MTAEYSDLTPAEKLQKIFEQTAPWTPDAAVTLPAPAPGGPPPATVIRIDQLADQPPLAWLVADVLPLDALTCLYGPPGAGKSFLALDWALSVATGQPWAGHDSEPGGVLYIAAEGHGGLNARISAWEAQYGPARHTEFYLQPAAVSLFDSAALDAVLAGVRAAGGDPAGLRLIVVDTLARAMLGGDENSSRDMGLAVEGAERLRHATGAAVVLVHHTGKNGVLERGSSALRCSCRMMISLTSEDEVISVRCDKVNESPKFPPTHWVLTPRADSCVLLLTDQAPPPDPNRDLSPSQRQVLEALAGPVLCGSASVSDLRAATGIAETTMYRVLKVLCERDLIFVDPDETRGLAKVYRLTEAGADMA